MSRLVRVWDLPTRVFHWGLALAVAAAWITAEDGGGAHRFFGFVATALVIFRLIWGVTGSETALFARFVDGPAAVAAYLRGAHPPRWGHNPLAGWAVLALLAGVGWTLATGLAIPAGADGAAATLAAPAFADEDENEDDDGGRAGEKAAEGAEAERHEAAFDLLSALVVLHVVAVFAYPFWRGENLLGPMLGAGRPAGEDAPPDPVLKDARAALPAAATAALVALVLFGFDVA